MKKSFVVLSILAVALILVAVFVALIYTKKEVTIEEQEKSSEMAVAIYGNGLMSISYTDEVDRNNPKIYLPKDAMLGSLRIEGPSVSGFREKEAGKKVYVETEMGDYEGIFLWENEDFLAIETEDKVIAIEKNRIKFYSPGETIKEIEILGWGEVNIFYSVPRAMWSLNYDLDVDKGVITARALVMSPVEIKNAKLSLMSGVPNTTGRWEREALGKSLPIEESMEEEEPWWGETFEERKEGEYYTYEMENVDLKKGLLNSLKLFDSKINLEKFYYWNTGRVEEMVRINNTARRVLPEGIISFYSGERWIGEDSIEYLSEEEEAELTLAYSQDIKVEKNLTYSKTGFFRRNTYEYTITLYNNKNESIRIEVEQVLPKETNLRNTVPKANVEGNKITWELVIPPKGSEALKYKYEKIIK